jgi:hypothetical protein
LLEVKVVLMQSKLQELVTQLMGQVEQELKELVKLMLMVVLELVEQPILVQGQQFLVAEWL